MIESERSDRPVSIRDLAKDLDLEIVYMPDDVEYYVHYQDIHRPGLQFAGYFEHFTYDRIQIVGRTEYTYFSHMDSETRRDVLDKFFSYEVPALIVSRGLTVKPDVIEMSKKHNRVVLATKRNTTRLINRLSNYLDSKLSPTTTIHGVLVDVFGVG
ncbi:MAG: HPr(Ser) kinase/phosphatase, partial [Paraclostridium sp.]